MTKDTCPIWGPDWPAEVISTLDLGLYVNSARAGGEYWIDRSCCWLKGPDYALYNHVKDIDRIRLTTWLVDQRRQSDSAPRITDAVIKRAQNARSLPVPKRAERLLRFLVDETGAVGEEIDLREDSLAAKALAWSGSVTVSELKSLSSYLMQRGWTIQPIAGVNIHVVAVDGYAEIEERQTNGDSSQAFVAMWFDDSMTVAYDDGFVPAIGEAGYTPMRIDRKEHSNKIDDEIVAEIRRSRFLIADFTQNGKEARGGVYYEAGFARGLDLPVIYTCKTDCQEELHFDIAHFNHIFWSSPEDLRKRLKDRIVAVVGEYHKIPSSH